MAVLHPRTAGQIINIDPNDKKSVGRALATNIATADQKQQTTARPSAGAPTKAAAANDGADSDPLHNRKMCIAVWSGGGWTDELIQMFDDFLEHDGQQDRSVYIVESPLLPTPQSVIMAAKRAFLNVRTYQTMFADPEPKGSNPPGITTPQALHDFAGFIGQKSGHKARIFYTIPVRILGPNSLAILERQAYQANPSRDQNNKLQGKAILGAAMETAKGKIPFSSFVALPSWVSEPEFPLFKGLSRWPAQTADDSPMQFLRFEILKQLAETPVINPQPWKNPSAKNIVLIEGIQLRERFPAQSVAAVAQVDVPTSTLPPVQLTEGNLGLPAAAIPEFVKPIEPPIADWIAKPKELPPIAETEARVEKEGLNWLIDYAWSADLRVIKAIHNAEVRRRAAAAAENQPLTELPAKATKAKAAKKQKAPLSVPAA